MKTTKKTTEKTILEELKALKELGVLEFATTNGAISYSVKFSTEKTYTEVPDYAMPTPADMNKPVTIDDELFNQGLGNAVV